MHGRLDLPTRGSKSQLLCEASRALTDRQSAIYLGRCLGGLGFLVQGCIFGQRHVVDTVPDFTCGYSIWEATSTVRAVSVAKYCFPGVQG